MTQGQALMIVVRACGKAAFAGAFADRTVEERDAIEHALGIAAGVADSVLTQEEATPKPEAAKQE